MIRTYNLSVNSTALYQLSYIRAKYFLAESNGFEPLVPVSRDAPLAGEWVKPLFQLSIWSPISDSNWWPIDYKSIALANWANRAFNGG